jgi:hypothetical protein
MALHSLIILIGIATFLTLAEQKSLMAPQLGHLLASPTNAATWEKEAYRGYL